MSEQQISNQFNLSISYPDFKFAVGLFTIVGITLGLTSAFAFSYFGGGESSSGILAGILSIIVLTIAFLLGPVVATVVGIYIHGGDADSSTKYITSGVGSFVGYILMIILLALVLTVSFGMMNAGSQADTGTETDGDGSSGSISIGSLLVPLIGFAIPTGIAGTATTWLASRFGAPSRGGEAGQSRDRDSSTGAATADTLRSVSNSTEEAMSQFQFPVNNGIQFISGRLSYPYAIVAGLLSILMTSVAVIIVVGFDPSVQTATDEFLFGIPLISVDFSTFGLVNTMPGWLTWFSWMVLSAHGVAIEGLSLDLTRIGLVRTIPGLILISAGYLFSKIRSSDSLPAACIDGSSIAVGYLVGIIALALLAPANASSSMFTESGLTSVSVLGAVLRAGIVYPVVFGGIGGAIQYYRRGAPSNGEREEVASEPVE